MDAHDFSEDRVLNMALVREQPVEFPPAKQCALRLQTRFRDAQIYEDSLEIVSMSTEKRIFKR